LNGDAADVVKIGPEIFGGQLWQLAMTG
jgi:hypothetical protein